MSVILERWCLSGACWGWHACVSVCVLFVRGDRKFQLGYLGCQVRGRSRSPCANVARSASSPYAGQDAHAATKHGWCKCLFVFSHTHMSYVFCPVCEFKEAGWRVLLQALATAPHCPKTVGGLEDDFVNARNFDPATVRDMKWPLELLRQPHPNAGILEFCRELRKGTHSGPPVASVVLLGPDGAGKSTLLHQLTKPELSTGFKCTAGVRIGACVLLASCPVLHDVR